MLAAFEQPFGSDRVKEVARWNGVERAEAALVIPVELTSPMGKHDAQVTAMAPGSGFHGFKVTAGRPADEALDAGGLVMAESVAKKLRVSVGDTLKAKSPYMKDPAPLKVLALSSETLGGPVFVSREVGRTLMASNRTEFNVLYLFVEPARADEIRKDLFDLPGASQVQVKAVFVQKLMDLMQFSLLFGGIMLAFGFAMAAAVIYNTFTTNVLERLREIATMRTIGEDDARVAIMITIENVLLALVAVPLGVWLGLRAADALYASFSTEAYSFSAVIYPQSVVWIVIINLVVLLLSEIPPILRVFRMDLGEATKVME